MNIYQKLVEMRVELKGMNIRKTGKNQFAGYDYYDLGDILPPILDVEKAHNVLSYVTFSQDTATLTLVDCDKPEDRIIFTSPMAEATLKGAHAIQNLGAVETYQRRYLYMAAFEIVEHDILDATQGKGQAQHKSQPKGRKPDRKPVQKTKTLSDAAGKALRSKLNEYTSITGMDEKNALSAISTATGLNMKNIDDADASRIVDMLDGWIEDVEMDIAGIEGGL